MIRIVMTDEQTQAIIGASDPIDLVDRSGRMLGRVAPPPSTFDEAPELSPEELAEIKRRMADAKKNGGTFLTWKEIKSRLQAQGDA